ncbi:hypothetical protein [Thiohalophilus sp.]|uniref:hypothetical protein n=1 Tax=Thiohalophilus sp. TaxID=3028392 RepID=UPI002ACE714A|nr:hypothetical protein [Thiohalophilus sp.]MDZ7805190.1 hypothetical protein [Thiohalophilus sp.]
MSNRLLAYTRPLVTRFWEICLLRKGPEDVPYSSPLLLLLLILGYAIDNLRVNLLLPGVTVGQLAGILLLHTLLMLSITAALLTMFGYRARIVQTLTALTGTGVILSLLMLPLDYITRLNPQNFTMASLIIMAMQIWSLVIVGHILSHALSVHRLTGVIIAIGYLILGLAAFNTLLPEAN